MQFPESWLRSFVDPPLSSEALAHALTMAGLEVEALSTVAPPCSDVVVGRVLDVSRHPDADRLRVCTVDIGNGATLSIVCGAPNVAPGIKAPCAKPGAQLPPAGPERDTPVRIRASRLRGVDSQGMLCSARELGISADGGGLLILPEDAPTGQDIRIALGLDEKIFTLKLTPNRADCLSVFGIAREVAAITGAPLHRPVFNPVPTLLSEILPAHIRAPELCGRFSARVLRNVNARAKTPAWMAGHLERSGQRSISALVDISNYVMLEFGHPSHVFDLERLTAPLEVRWGRTGETLTLLNGQTITLDTNTGVIADPHAAQSLAGIMGGAHTAVSLDTRHIRVEMAFWHPDAIRGRARRYNVSSEAAHRFERGVDYSDTTEQLEYLTRLILDICGGQAGPINDQIAQAPERAPVELRIERANQCIGITLSADEMAGILARLALPFARNGASLMVTPPAYRFDLEHEIDLIEEIARIHGFDRIPARMPVAQTRLRPPAQDPHARRSLHAVRHALAARDYTETVNFSFVDARWERDLAGNATPVRLLNPIAQHYSALRSTLFGSLVHVLRHNLNRKAARVRLFEAGRVFHADPTISADTFNIADFAQTLMTGALAYGPVWEEQWGTATRLVDFFDVKGDLEALLAPHPARFVKAEHPALHPGRSARIDLDHQSIGWIGELHPRWLKEYDLPHPPILFEVQAHALRERSLPAISGISKFPLVTRDIALMVNAQIEAQQLLDAMHALRQQSACRSIQHIALFDEFRPNDNRPEAFKEGERSLAFRIILQDKKGTLHEHAVNRAIQTMVEHLARVYDVRVRT
ncbi:Phenylalanyl-tRNA synthetase beta chain (Phenylalanine--tRNA ligase beta chain) (PheRS) [Candidatus Glomeribacter gigasporarum BEG34]|uniref:Phenylalanine--tRNA ligase beta subunit n=1 Tax=Candidatus Glomeribacter gigasporarum BEG34 TaxID=1070319 RepID=G2J8D0_9BURK|nr:phenylalanine--tRNA ligase subunit beta [Candidatus Glomeribacter gigasporarum]CCD29027.1 Phenylalanyl-tRNA synthetase beta chain (Phenylalanine--tRNA ligase beta chain) (PheRS) [Candidatus Glomeribacter gigasporarum BEG34]